MAKQKYNIVSGTSQRVYHSIPSELNLIQTNPTREGIFQALSQIPYNQFPEFVADILVRIEKHKLEDVTDGQGDEKQDILTITPEGKRCLTQCKHSINYNSRHSGDELDLMLGACLRKTCSEAHYVTNSDLTPQAKRYINDGEYKRGWPADPSLCPKIDYWTGHDIWEKIKNDAAIMNKWFSGLGQTVGLRSFKFDLTIQKLPYKNSNDDSGISEIINMIKQKQWAREIHPDYAYAIDFNNEFTANLKRWFQFSGNLDINFILPNDDVDFLQKPMYALTVEIVANKNLGVFSFKGLRNKLISFLADEILIDLGAASWWHLTSSQIKGNLFLHDLNEPREIIIESATTFVKFQNTEVQDEIDFCNLTIDKYELNTADGDTDTIWTHRENGIQIIELFDQKINPVEDYHHQVANYHKADELKLYSFNAVEGIDSLMMMRIRQQLPSDCIAMESNESALLWGYPPGMDQGVIDHTKNKIAAIGLKVLAVEGDLIKNMIDSLRVDPSPRFYIHSDFKSLSFPISLEKRIFWLSRDIEFEQDISLEQQMGLLRYKYTFESENGFHNMGEKTEMQIKDYEIKGFLYNIMTLRGTRMMDIGIMSNKKISLNIRFGEHKIASTTTLVEYYISEFLKIERSLVESFGKSPNPN